MLKVCDVLCPDKKQMLANVSLSRNTVADRVCEMATDLRTQLTERSKDFIAYSLAVDESTDVTDTVQLAIFIRGVDSDLSVTEEILDIKSMHGTTTGKDIFENVCQSVSDMKLPWDKLVGLTTDGAPAMFDGTSGLVGRMRAKMREENCTVMVNQVGATMFPNTHFSDKLSALPTEFLRRIADFEAQKNNFKLLRNPFAVEVETAPEQIQMELIELN
ncbi:uncharacterized protein V6R79_021542 [Siganus canaliculatus]